MYTKVQCTMVHSYNSCIACTYITANYIRVVCKQAHLSKLVCFKGIFIKLFCWKINSWTNISQVGLPSSNAHANSFHILLAFVKITFQLRDTTVQCKWSTFFSLVYTQGERKHANPIQWNLHLCFFLYLSKGFLPLWPLCRGNPFILTRRCLNGT